MRADFGFYTTSMEIWLIFFSATALAKEEKKNNSNRI